MRQATYGIQLYMLQSLAVTDFEETLRLVADIGYKDVELPGFYSKTGAELRSALSAADLACSSIHIHARPWSPGDHSLDGDISAPSDEIHALGAQDVVMPLFRIPDRLNAPRSAHETGAEHLARLAARMTADDWKANADYMNEKALALNKNGLRFAYHNHNAEFATVDGQPAFQFILDNTDAALVGFEVDVGWLIAAGKNPQDFLTKHHKRIRMLHVKDAFGGKPNTHLAIEEAPLGTGAGNWQDLLPLAHRLGINRFFVENERENIALALQAARDSFMFLNKTSAVA